MLLCISALISNVRTRKGKRQLTAECALRDKPTWTDNLASQAETVAQANNMRDLYRISKQLTRNDFNSSRPLKAATEKQQLDR